MKKLGLLTLVLVFVPFAAHADMVWLDKLTAMVPDASAGWISSVAVGLELLLRIFKTEKPKSILYYISDLMKGISALFGKAGVLLDKLLPQRLK